MSGTANKANQKMWENVRQVIEHHDAIINQRLTWYLVINGFLFAACAAIVGQFEKVDLYYKIVLWGWLFAITLCASVLSQIAFNLLRLPTHNLYEVRKKWWGDYCKRHTINPEDFPPVSGWKSGYNKLWFHTLTTIPRILKYAWLFSNFCLAVAAWYSAYNSSVNVCILTGCAAVYVVCLVAWGWYAEKNAAIKLGTLTDDDA